MSGRGPWLQSRSAAGLALTAACWASSCDGTQTPAPTPGPGGPSATVEGAVYFFHNDRLGTPVRLTNEAGATVWRAEYRPFGDVQRLETDVDGDGVHVEQPLRFPGQYDDAMSALLLAQGPYFNFHRLYDPATGRYLSQEPMLRSPRWVKQESRRAFSAPTYAYARSRPMRYTDRTGLFPGVAALPWWGPVTPVVVPFLPEVGVVAIGGAVTIGAGAIISTGVGQFPDPGAGVPLPPALPLPPIPHPATEPGVPTCTAVATAASGATAMAPADEVNCGIFGWKAQIKCERERVKSMAECESFGQVCMDACLEGRRPVECIE